MIFILNSLNNIPNRPILSKSVPHIKTKNHDIAIADIIIYPLKIILLLN